MLMVFQWAMNRWWAKKNKNYFVKYQFQFGVFLGIPLDSDDENAVTPDPPVLDTTPSDATSSDLLILYKLYQT